MKNSAAFILSGFAWQGIGSSALILLARRGAALGPHTNGSTWEKRVRDALLREAKRAGT